MLNFQTAFDFSGQVAIITGAASGIGRSMAEIFYERGLRLALFDRSASVTELAASLGERARGVIADIGDADAVASAVATVADEFGRIDILVNNAGIGMVGPAESASIEEFDRAIGINLRGQYVVTRAVAPHMITRGYGRIIFLSSQAAIVGIDDHTAYSTSKAGLLGMARCMAVEWGRRGVTVNAISPTIVNTAMAQVGWAGEKGQRARSEIPVGRFAEPEEIALAALFLASGAASMINGTNLVVDGGFTIR